MPRRRKGNPLYPHNAFTVTNEEPCGKGEGGEGSLGEAAEAAEGLRA